MDNNTAKNFFAFIGTFVVAVGMFGAGATLAGCNDRATELNVLHMDITYRLLVIDGCQYIQCGEGLAHKGNCTNRLHTYNHILEDPK